MRPVPTIDLTIGALLEERRVRSVFQPIVDLSTRTVVGLEALARGPAGTTLEFPDRLFAEAQDHSGRNNANAMVPPDGTAPRIQMFVFSGASNAELNVTAPASIAGTKNVGIASGFGADVFDVSGSVVLAADGEGADAADACEPLEAGAAGKIVLAHRGTCSFAQKAATAQEAAKVTYDEHVMPIFRAKCLGCHNSDKVSGGLDLSSYTAMLVGGGSGEVIAPGARANVLQSFTDKPMAFDAWDIDVYYQERLHEVDALEEAVVEEAGPLRGVLRLRWRLRASTITQRLTVYADDPRIDFRSEADWRERQVLLKAAFPLDIRASRATS